MFAARMFKISSYSGNLFQSDVEVTYILKRAKVATGTVQCMERIGLC